MPTTKDIVLDDKWKLLVFAQFKMGKTFGALTFPRPNVIDFDHGIKTVLNPEFIRQHGYKEVQYFQPMREADKLGVPKNYNAFDAACRYFDECMAPAKRDTFDTWVLDSCTTLIDMAQDKAIILLGDATFKGAGSNTYKEAQMKGLVVPKKQDYGAERSMTESFVRMLRDSGKHCIVICHEREISKDDGTITAIVPLLTGKSQQDIPIMFDEVYRLQAKRQGEEIIRSLQTEPVTVEKVGSRLGIKSGTLWNFESLQKALADNKAEREKVIQAQKASQPASVASTTAAK